MKTQLSMLWGATRFEFLMQWRRPALWLGMGVTMIFLSYWQRGPTGALLLRLENWQHIIISPTQAVVNWADQINRFLPIMLGILLADRFPRDQQIKIAELQNTFPAGQSIRLWGKFLGSLLATLIPVLIYYSLGVAVLLIQSHDAALLPTALLAFLSIMLPGMIFVGAFSVALPAFLWWPLYCFCFTAYWFWGNLLSLKQHIPTISETILTPVGGYMSQGLFGVIPDGPPINATPLSAIESIGLLLALAVCVLVIIWGLLKWQQSLQ